MAFITKKKGTKILRLEMDQAKMNENENLKPREILILPKVKFQKLCTPPEIERRRGNNEPASFIFITYAVPTIQSREPDLGESCCHNI